MSSSKPEEHRDSRGHGPTSTVSEPAKAGQSDRLADALRDNLKRRKAQARARRETGSGRDEG